MGAGMGSAATGAGTSLAAAMAGGASCGIPPIGSGAEGMLGGCMLGAAGFGMLGACAAGAGAGAGAADVAEVPAPPDFWWIESSTSAAKALSVGNTPWPVLATPSNEGRPVGFRALSSSATGSASGRSRLLYWMTIGMVANSLPYSVRFSCRLRSDSRFSSIIDAEESATKITPSTPCRTSLRVEL